MHNIHLTFVSVTSVVHNVPLQHELKLLLLKSATLGGTLRRRHCACCDAKSRSAHILLCARGVYCAVGEVCESHHFAEAVRPCVYLAAAHICSLSRRTGQNTQL